MRPNIYGAPPTNEEAAPDEMQACMRLPDHLGTDPIFGMLLSQFLYFKLPSTSVVIVNTTNIIIFDTQSVSARSLITRQDLSSPPLVPACRSASASSFRRRRRNFCLVSHVAANTENQAGDKEERDGS